MGVSIQSTSSGGGRLYLPLWGETWSYRTLPVVRPAQSVVGNPRYCPARDSSRIDGAIPRYEMEADVRNPRSDSRAHLFGADACTPMDCYLSDMRTRLRAVQAAVTQAQLLLPQVPPESPARALLAALNEVRVTSVDLNVVGRHANRLRAVRASGAGIRAFRGCRESLLEADRQRAPATRDRPPRRSLPGCIHFPFRVHRP